ncbi:DUF1845 domain-containing protein [Pseudomonas sp. MWU12-2323]|nr:DUF1845 domain-containing protein [Pseudomonas sp. MWU12-2323]
MPERVAIDGCLPASDIGTGAGAKRARRWARLAKPYRVLTQLSIEKKRGCGLLPMSARVGDNLHVHPVTMPLCINTPLGFLAVYRLIDYDNIVLRLLLAYHSALMGRRDMERWINAGGRVLRSLFSLAQQERLSGTMREDFIANNAAAREAQERLGQQRVTEIEQLLPHQWMPA